MWSLWRQCRKAGTTSPALQKAKNDAMQQHQALLAQIRSLKAPTAARAKAKYTRRYISLHRHLAA